MKTCLFSRPCHPRIATGSILRSALPWALSFAMLLPSASVAGGNGVVDTLAATAPTTALAAQGRALYFGTQAFAAPARVAGARLPASAAACVSCHGALGAGAREGVQVAPDITQRGTGTPVNWLSAAMQGLTTGQRQLNASMPRYELTPVEQAALAAYAPLLGHVDDAVRGVTDIGIVLGVFVPGTTGSLAGELILQGVTQAFAQANLRGGVHGRQLSAMAVRTAEQAMSVFALVGSLNQDDSVDRLLATFRVPSLAALSLSRENLSARGWVAPLLPSLHEQAVFLLRALVAKSASLQCTPWLLDTVQLTRETDPAIGAVRRFTRVQDAVVAGRPQRLCLGLIAPEPSSAPLLRALEGDGTQVPLLLSLTAIGPSDNNLKSVIHWQVLPTPAAVAAHAGATGQSVWTSLGLVAGGAVVEALSRSGRRLQPEIALASLRELGGYAPLEGAALAWSRSSAHGWRPVLWTSSNHHAGTGHSEQSQGE